MSSKNKVISNTSFGILGETLVNKIRDTVNGDNNLIGNKKDGSEDSKDNKKIRNHFKDDKKVY